MVIQEHRDVIRIINGYSYIITSTGEYEDVIEFSPWSGKELTNGFMWELQHKLYDILRKNENGMITPVEDLYCNTKESEKIESLLTSKFNPDSVPDNLKFLFNNRDWFNEIIAKNRLDHTNDGDRFCGGFSAFIDSCYGMEELPRIVTIPINFCPYCGIKLPPEFQTDEWWKKRGL